MFAQYGGGGGGGDSSYEDQKDISEGFGGNDYGDSQQKESSGGYGGSSGLFFSLFPKSIRPACLTLFDLAFRRRLVVFAKKQRPSIR